MKSVYLGFVWFCELFYVGLTICYLAPENPLKVYIKVPLEYFQDVCYQNWSFFAPPPTSELRVYLLIDADDSNRNDQNVVLDLTSHLSKEKRRAFPFSWRENFNEYVLGGAAQGQLRGLAKIEEKLLSIEEFLDLGEEEATKLRRDLSQGHNELRSSQALKSYCVKAAAILGIQPSNNDAKRMRYAIVSYSYPKFIDRKRTDFSPKMSLHYLSDTF